MEAEPEPEPAEEPILTIPPVSRPRETSFAWPTPEKEKVKAPPRIKPLWIIGGLGVIGALVAVVAVFALGGSKGEKKAGPEPAPPPVSPQPQETTPQETTPAPPPAAGTPLAPSELITLAVSGSTVFAADPNGRLLSLEGGKLEPKALLADPALPRSVVVAGDKVYVADDATFTAYDAETMTPASAEKLGPGAILASDSDPRAGDQEVVAAANGRLCLEQLGKLDPCADLAFEPTGLGVADGGRVFVADGSSGTVVPYSLEGGALTAGDPLDVGKGPHGTLVAFRDKLYVPVNENVAVIDLRDNKVLLPIWTETTPASIWVVPFNGKLFATFPDTNEVAIIDTASPGDPPTRISVGRRPVAVAGALTSAGSGDVVYVANAGDGTISLLDALTGEVVSSPAVKSLGAETPGAITASSVSIEKSDRTITATIQLDGGKLDKRGLVVKDKDISDDRATIELWQGSISAQVDKKTAEGLSVQVKEEAGRLVLTVSGKGFTSMKARLGSSGQTVILQVTAAAAAPPPPSPTPTPPPGPPPPPPPPQFQVG